MSDKAARIQSVLDEHHPDPPVPLAHADAFTLLVAVVLSAQTTDKKVNEVTPALFARAPTPAAMRATPVAEIQALIHQVNFSPAKAKNLQGLAAMLCDLHHGAVPNDFDALVALPGVGRKTANVVVSHVFGVPAFPVDTHIFRLAHRWGLSKGKTPDDVERDLTRIFPRTAWNKLHLQIIYFGRSHCPALRHDLTLCPICGWAATKARVAEEARMNAKLGTRARKKP